MEKTTEAKPVARGFPDLVCLACGKANGCQLDLENCDNVFCVHCETTLSLRDDVEPRLAGWQRVLDWVALSPLTD